MVEILLLVSNRLCFQVISLIVVVSCLEFSAERNVCASVNDNLLLPLYPNSWPVLLLTFPRLRFAS